MERDLDSNRIIETGERFFYQADGLGSITELTNMTGTVSQSYTCSSVGKIESQLNPALIQPYTYTAREFDGETGLFETIWGTEVNQPTLSNCGSPRLFRLSNIE